MGVGKLILSVKGGQLDTEVSCSGAQTLWARQDGGTS